MYFDKLYRILKNKELSVVKGNFFYLLLINISNFLLPLITFPYLVITIGVEKFGFLSFVTSIITYFLVFTDYGFNLTATRLVSINRSNNDKVSEIFSSVITLKMALFFASFIVLSLLILIVPKFQEYSFVYLINFGMVLGQVIFPIWFFQGIEKMKIISILNVSSKILFTIGVFILVKKENDFYIVPMLSSLGSLLVGVISLFIIRLKYNIRFNFQSLGKLIFYLKDGWHIFISNISVTLYTTFTVTLLGLFTNNTIVGVYSIADRIISAIRSLITPISQSLYPYLCKISIDNPKKVLEFNRKLLFILAPIFLLASVTLFFSAELVIKLLFGDNGVESVKVLKILSIIPFIILLHIIYALFTMLVLNKNKEYSRIIISAAVINIFLSYFLIKNYGHIGAAISIVTIEFYLFLRYFIYTFKNKMRII